MSARSGRLVAPGLWRKRCPECGREFVKGRRATHCEPCRLKLKAWRKRTRREIRRAKLGLFPGQKARVLSETRKRTRRPRRKNLHRYREHVCVDCGVRFRAGARAARCIECFDRDRRAKQARYDRTRPRRDSGQGSKPDHFQAAG